MVSTSIAPAADREGPQALSPGSVRFSGSHVKGAMTEEAAAHMGSRSTF